MLCGLQQLSPVKGNVAKYRHAAAQALTSLPHTSHEDPPAATGPGSVNAHTGLGEQSQHLPASAETGCPEEGDSEAGSGRRAPLGPAGVPARPRPRAGPAQPRSPAHRAVTGGSAPLPVTGPCSPMPCQITRGTAVAAKPRRSPSSSTTAALNAAILTEHMTRARHRSGVEGAAWRGRDQPGAGSVLKGGGSSLGRGLDGRGVV